VPKFNVQNVEFFKRIVSGQNFLFVDTALGLICGFIMILYRELILQYMLQGNLIVGKSIAEFDINKNIPFGIKPDTYIFQSLAHADYFLLL